MCLLHLELKTPYISAMKDQIYIDYNASAPLRKEARVLMIEIMDMPHNASSVHSFGRKGRAYIEKAREQVANLVGAPSAQVIFNSGATEANNTVLHHFTGATILVSATEHLSVLESQNDLIKIPVDNNGLIDLSVFEALLTKEKPALVSIMLANNETGVIQPIVELSALAHKHGALFHCDAVQAVGRMPVNISELGVDFMTISSHKIGGPQGVGAIILGLCGITPTLLYGGGQEKKARAGTENVAGIAGFGAAAELAKQELKQFQHLEELRDNFEKNLKDISPEIIIHGKNAPRTANTSLFSLPGAHTETMMIAFDLEGIAISNGSACSSGTVRASYVLEAMGYKKDITSSALRISIGWDTKQSDLERFLDVWSDIYNRIQNKMSAHA